MIEHNPMRRTGTPLSPERLAAFEVQLGFDLPQGSRQFLLESNGGDPTKAFFRCHVGPAPTWMAPKWRAKWSEWHNPWVVEFFGLDRWLKATDSEDPTDQLSWWWTRDWLMLPEDVLPIASVVRDDLLLLHLRGPRRGEVHLLCSDYIDARAEPTPEATRAAIRFVAPSFEEFFASLVDER